MKHMKSMNERKPHERIITDVCLGMARTLGVFFKRLFNTMKCSNQRNVYRVGSRSAFVPNMKFIFKNMELRIYGSVSDQRETLTSIEKLCSIVLNDSIMRVYSRTKIS